MKPNHLPSGSECVIVGAGLAGAATAYALSRAGMTQLLVLEQERTAGVHASGRNAAMAYSFIAETEIRTLARRGLAWLADPPEDFPLAMDNRWTGSLSLVEPHLEPSFAPQLEAMRAEAITLRRSPAERVRELVPLLGSSADPGYFCPEDGVVDVNALLQGYLRFATARGAQVRYGCRAEALETRGGRVVGIHTSQGAVSTPQVVLAGGPWADEIARTAGLSPMPLSPRRRHLAILVKTDVAPDPAWPFVWHQTRSLYFRPESGGLLVSACDEEEIPPCDVAADPEMVANLAERTLALLPGASGALIRRSWAGLRTLTPDGRFILGPDPRLEGLSWAAGLGGHGMTTSPAVGEIVAKQLMGLKSIDPVASALLPDRFL